MSKIINLFDVKSKYQAINLIILMTLASVLELLGIGFVILVLTFFLGINDICIYRNFIKLFSPKKIMKVFTIFYF